MPGLIGKENAKTYIKNIKTILNQDYDNFKIVVSSCFNSQGCINEVLEELGDKISINIVNHRFAVQQSFNKTVNDSIRHFKKFFDGYLYVASDVFFGEEKDNLEKLSRRLENKYNGITSPEVNNDSGLYWWLNFPEEKSLFEIYGKDKDFVMPVGSTCNMHCMLFSDKIRQEYGNILPDIFTSYCGESIYSFLVAAINQKFVITNDVLVNHREKKDIRGQVVESVDRTD